MHRLNKTECLLIGFSVFHGLAKLFLGTFVVSFLMHNSINEIISVSVYNLFFYFAIMLTYVALVAWCKRGDIKKVFASHLLVQMVLIFLIAVLGERAAGMVMVLGMLYGAQHALYSMSIQRMIIDKVSAKRMMFFYASDTAITSVAKIIIPVILGTLITVGSLQNIAWVILVMCVIELAMLSMLAPSKYHETQKADLIGFIANATKLPCMRKLFLAEFLRGLAYILETVGTMYIVYVFHTDMNLGAWTTVFALCTAAATWTFGRFCSKRDFKWVIASVSLLLIGAIICLMIDVNRFSVLAYAGTLALGIEMMDQVCSINVFNLAKTDLITKTYRQEYLAARQLISFFGRWGGTILLLYVGVFSGYSLLPYLVIVLAFSRILAAMLYVKIGKYTKC